MQRYNRVLIKFKKIVMGFFLCISLGVVGACVYKMYLDIDVKPGSAFNENIYAEKLSQELELNNENKNNIASVVEEVIPTVVGISKLKDSGNSIFLKDSVSKLGLGTGVVISENGYILTNQHVAGNKYSNCYITLDNGKVYNGNVVWADIDLDLAVIKINARGLNYIRIRRFR